MTEQQKDENLPNGTTGVGNVENDNGAHDSSVLEGSSDGEGERATRRRLEETTLAGQQNQQSRTSEDILDTSVDGNVNGSRGRPAKKRSFEDLTRGDAEGAPTEQPTAKSGHHKRMRSRDVAVGSDLPAKLTDVASPLHGEGDMDTQSSPQRVGQSTQQTTNLDVVAETADDTSENLTQTKEKASSLQSTTSTTSTNTAKDANAESSVSATSNTIAPSSGFANASTASPFGALKSPTTSTATSTSETQKTTSSSSSAFSSSGLSAFASTDKSPFGATANKATGGFGSGASKIGGFGSSTGGFGNTIASPFASKPQSSFGGSGGGFSSSSGFGSTSAFGAPKPFGSGTSSFGGSSGAPSSFAASKPFGTKKEKDDDDGSENDEENSGAGEEEQQQDTRDEHDERFVAQEVDTGETGERTVFTCRAKLYHFEKEWKEKGVGTLKLNLREEDISVQENETRETSNSEDVESGTRQTRTVGRLIMRTDAVHRVILNTPIFDNMQIGQHDGSEPSGKTMHLTGLEDGKPVMFQLKIGKEEVLKDLYWRVIELRGST